MSDRVAVFNQGRIEQIGTPSEVYERPATAFVAGFVGSSNIVDAATAERLFGRAQAFALRPERIAARRARPRSRSRARWSAIQYHGASTRLEVRARRRAGAGGRPRQRRLAAGGRRRASGCGSAGRAAAMQPLREP